MAIRATRVLAEALGTTTGQIRATRVLAEAIGEPAEPEARLVRFMCHVIRKRFAPIDRTVTHSVILTHGVAAVPIDVSVTHTVELSHIAAPWINELLTQTVVLSHVAEAIVPRIEHTVVLTHGVVDGLGRDVEASHMVVLTGEAKSQFTSAAVTHTVVLTGEAHENTLFPSVEQTVVLSQQLDMFIFNPNGTDETVTHTVILTHKLVAEVHNEDATHTILLTATAEADLVRDVTHTVILSHTADRRMIRPTDVTHTVVLTQSILIESDSIDTCLYDPQVGTGSSIIPRLPPNLNKRTSMTLTSSTSSITLRAPEFGDREQVAPDRVVRETQGGQLEVSADVDWNVSTKVLISIIDIAEEQTQEYLTFIQNSAGEEITVEDWFAVERKAIMLSTGEAVTRTASDSNDITIELLVTQ